MLIAAQNAITITSISRIIDQRKRPDSPARPKLDDHRRDEHAAEHEDVAVGEVDQLEDAVDERVAERDEAVDRAVREADQEQAVELGRRLDQVDAEPDDEQPTTSSAAERRHHDTAAGGRRGSGTVGGAPA